MNFSNNIDKITDLVQRKFTAGVINSNKNAVFVRAIEVVRRIKNIHSINSR